MKRIRIGIFFGGKSREREISFAGGRTVYDNLDKGLFEAIPIFVDSYGQFIHLDWPNLYKGSIRDFYPPASALVSEPQEYSIYADSLEEASSQQKEAWANEIGRLISLDSLKELIDFAFLALHGNYGEDGSIQGLLQYLDIPFSASGILPSAIGMDKSFQKKFMEGLGFPVPSYQIVNRSQWDKSSLENKKITFEKAIANIGENLVVKAANQGSSLGISILIKPDFNTFLEALDSSFFTQKLDLNEWNKFSKKEKLDFVKNLIDFRKGLGLPVKIDFNGNEKWCFKPNHLLEEINKLSSLKESNDTLANIINLVSADQESTVLLEQFIKGKEFSCVVIRDEQSNIIALPPTEIQKGKELFDYRSKYLPGLSRKVTPINLDKNEIERIRLSCSRLFDELGCHVYARIDGFYTESGEIFLNDPNTTSGMLPSSFFFHQAAEIGLNPSQFLTYIIHQSLVERSTSLSKVRTVKTLLKELETLIQSSKELKSSRVNIAVVMGGYSSERHISVESGRNIYEKLAASGKYEPLPIFLKGNSSSYSLHLIPINVMLKDNADDIKDKIENFKVHPIIHEIKSECSLIIDKFASSSVNWKPEELPINKLEEKFDFVFIALHGRPGEDGDLQDHLENLGIPYNGSNSKASSRTINKYETNQFLKEHGIHVADQLVLSKEDWLLQQENANKNFEGHIPYPLIAKPLDDGCSSAVKLIPNSTKLDVYAAAIFREKELLETKIEEELDLKPKELFPQKNSFLIESLISKGSCAHFLEITGGLITHYKNNELVYEMFEPSEALSSSSILSLEEKFLAGQGQNITPARYNPDTKRSSEISKVVQNELKKVASLLNIQGYARIDAFVKIYDNNKIEVFVIEVNSLPGMTPATAIFHQCAINGYTPFQFIDKIIEFGMDRVKLGQA